MIIHNQSKTQSLQRKSFKYAYFFRRSTWATQEMQSCRRGNLESEAILGHVISKKMETGWAQNHGADPRGSTVREGT